jgi:hypothetical protein
MGLLSRLFGSRSAQPAPPRRDPSQPEASFVVTVSDAEVRCDRPDGRAERVPWEDLKAVIIQTTADGPFAPDVYWMLVGSSATSGCVIPWGATGERELLKRLQDLPKFNNDAVCRAASCSHEQMFLCWERPKGTA